MCLCCVYVCVRVCQDNNSKMNRHQLSEHAKQKLYEQLSVNQKREIDEQAKLLVLEREAKLLEIEKLRTLRTIKEANSTRLFENTDQQLTREEDVLHHTLTDATDAATRAAGIRELASRPEISQPRVELYQMALDVQATQLQAEEAQTQATLLAMQQEHEAKMAQLARKKEDIIAEKALSLASTVATARELVDKQQRQQTGRRQASEKMIRPTSSTTNTNQESSSEVNHHFLQQQQLPHQGYYQSETGSDHRSVDSDNSDALFQQALRFVNLETSPDKHEDVALHDEFSRGGAGAGGGELSEDMIISAIEVTRLFSSVIHLPL